MKGGITSGVIYLPRGHDRWARGALVSGRAGGRWAVWASVKSRPSATTVSVTQCDEWTLTHVQRLLGQSSGDDERVSDTGVGI